LLAEAGVTVFCGGRGGVMEAVARGASGAGVLTIIVQPPDFPVADVFCQVKRTSQSE